MTTFLLFLIICLQGVILLRLATVEREITACRVALAAALKDRFDAMALVKERITQRVAEWKAGGGRELLRERLRKRAEGQQ